MLQFWTHVPLTLQRFTRFASDQDGHLATTRAYRPNKQYYVPYSGEEDTAPEEFKTRIGLPVTKAFPLDEGWHLPNEPSRKQLSPDSEDDLRRLTDLDIHAMTAFFTEQYVRARAEALDYNPDHITPNCESAWGLRLQPQSAVPWEEIWRSLGTPLSDPSEEKSYRRLLHRAINAKNRHPLNPDHSCRLHCGATESMLHMVTCPRVKKLWKWCIDFCKNALGESCPQIDPTYAVILGVNRSTMKLLSEPTRAFLRHAFGIYYRDAVNVAKHGTTLLVESTFHGALKSFRNALLRYAYAIRLLYVHRMRTNLTEQVPETTRKRYAPFLTMNADGTSAVSRAVTDALGARRV